MASSDSKRVAKNAVFLYVRMIVLLLVQLYAARIVLNALGFDEYGLYSVVGAIVVFLGFVNISMSAASQRFLSFAHGKKKERYVNEVFNSVFVTQLLIAVLILILAETIGVVYIQHFLKVEDRLRPVAHIVFQLSLLSFITKTVSVSYTASIIANERMNIYAILSLLEGGLQLGSALFLSCFSSNRLVLYSVFIAFSVIVVQFSYAVYCRRKFVECKVNRQWKKPIIKEILSYSGWNLLGSFSSVAIDQGVNMILNSFFGVVVNAARGIAFQVSGGIASLSGNFQQALNPQIVKTYASENFSKMQTLIRKGTRLCYFLLLIFSLPVFFNISPILKLWLEKVPPLTAQFCQLVLINSLLTALSGCLLMAAMATGKIKKYQMIVAAINISNLPLSYIALRIYPNPLITVVVMIVISFIGFIARLILSSRLVNMSIQAFIVETLRYTVSTTIVAAFLCYTTNFIFNNLIQCGFLINVFILFLIVIVCIILIGLTSEERRMVYTIFVNKYETCFKK